MLPVRKHPVSGSRQHLQGQPDLNNGQLPGCLKDVLYLDSDVLAQFLFFKSKVYLFFTFNIIFYLFQVYSGVVRQSHTVQSVPPPIFPRSTLHSYYNIIDSVPCASNIWFLNLLTTIDVSLYGQYKTLVHHML